MNKQVTLPTDDLKKAMRLISKVIPRKTTIPVLGQMLMAVGKKSTVLTATNLDIEINRVIYHEPSWKSFSLIVSPKAIEAALRSGSDEITITKTDEGYSIEAGDLTLDCTSWIDVSEFPEMSLDSSNVGGSKRSRCKMSEADLHRMLKTVTPFISSDPKRFYLNGAHILSIEGKMRAEATNGHALARIDTDHDWAAPPMILHSAAVKILMAELKERGNREIKITASDTEKTPARVMFNIDGCTIKAKTIDEKFPGTDHIISKGGDNIGCTVTAAQLSKMPRFDKRRPWQAIFNPIDQTLSMRDPEVGKASVQMEICGDAAFSINPKYIKAVIDASGGDVRLSGSNANYPFSATAIDPILGEPIKGTTFIIMPMRA